MRLTLLFDTQSTEKNSR